MLNIIFFASPEFAIPSLEALATNPNFCVQAVITQPDKKVGRHGEVTGTPIKQTAHRLGLPCFSVSSHSELKKILADYQTDFYIVIAFGMILKEEILQMPKIASINVHASLLPKYRGASPIQQALLNRDPETGISIMQMDSKLDHGAVYLLKQVPIDSDDNLLTLSEKLAYTSAKVLPISLIDISEGNLTAIAQDHSQATFCQKIQKNDGLINWQKSSEEIIAQIKAYTPWPGSFCLHNGKKVKIIAAEAKETKLPAGQFTKIQKELFVGTADGSLIIKSIQPEGKKVLSGSEYANGLQN